MSEQKKTLLKVNDINVYYGAIHAIKGISLEVREDEIVTLIGANGAGKSTTLNTIAGLLKPRTGTIEFAGTTLNGVPASKVVPLGLSLCPEGRRIFQQMTVRENLEMGGYTRPASEVPGSMDEMFQRFPRLKEREKQIAGTLSGGEQQMLAMARALMNRPRLLMLDDSSSALDFRTDRALRHALRERHGNATTLIVAQRVSAVMASDLILVMDRGRIVGRGTHAELIRTCPMYRELCELQLGGDAA